MNMAMQTSALLKMAPFKGGIQDPSSAVVSPQETPRPINLGRTKTNDPEISIFGADKYFNTYKDYDSSSKHGNENGTAVDLHQLARNIRPKTPSVSSEASSWNSRNSQTALLQVIPRDSSHSKQKRAVGLRFFPLFGCKGPCLDKKSVYINETVDDAVLQGIKQSQPGLKKGEQFSFPVLNSGIENLTVKKQFAEEIILDPRKSIEVFGSVTKKKGDIAVNLERKLSMLTWDAIPKTKPLLTSSFGNSTVCDDMASDASSDLFEIENISGTGYSEFTRQESCNMSSCMSPTTMYAPSEASIEWSVVTASAADFSSVISDSVSVAGDARATYRTGKPKDSGRKEAQKSGPSRLLGCNSHKSVKVAESAYRTGAEKTISELKHSFAIRELSA